MISAERITDVVAEHGEGPCWDERSGRLFSVDMLAGAVLSTDISSGETERIPVVGPIAAFVRPLRDQDGIAVVCERDIQLLSEDGCETLVALPLPDGIRCNEGACDAQGRLYIGTLAYELTPAAGGMYRVSGNDEIELVLDGLTISNGLGWSPDGSVAYFVDSATRRLDRFEFDAEEGRLHSRAPLVEFTEGDGHPDGLCVDAEGGVWVALVGGGAVNRYDPDGTLSDRVEVDCPPITACAFGGPELSTLFMTTSRYGGNPSGSTSAGSLFACSPGVVGLPVDGFAFPARGEV
jgi:sugar lactone lactonase YvrE